MNIYDKHNPLGIRDKSNLILKAENQVEVIKALLKWRKEPLAFFEVVDATRIHRDSVKRTLTDLTNEVDGYGRPFALKRLDVKKANPDTGIRCCTYQFNPEYGKAQPNPGEQMNLLVQGCVV